jgi:hypothetical protein
VPALPRDTDATWGRPITLCRSRDWTKRRLLYGLANKQVAFQTIPPGHEGEVDWSDPDVQNSFDLETGEVEVYDPELEREQYVRTRHFIAIGDGRKILGIEVALPPKPLLPGKRWTKPPSATVIETAALAVAKIYQRGDPPTQAEWWAALNTELGKPVPRKVALGALADWAPQLQRQRGQKPNRQS